MRQKYGAPVKVWCGMLIEAGKFKEYIIINHYGLLRAFRLKIGDKSMVLPVSFELTTSGL
jgi:hypothetical protein